jgi:hypothetical protein
MNIASRFLITCTFTAFACSGFAQNPPPQEQRNAMAELFAKQAAIPDTQGTGKFPALKEETASLPDHVIYRPAKLSDLGPVKLGIYIFGNGACSNDGASSRLHLLEIASHGYLAIAPGRIRNGPGATVASSSSSTSSANEAGVPRGLPTPPTHHKDLISALDWALAQNSDSKSLYYKGIDVTAVAVSGFSCGGLQALQIAADPRIKTVVVMNSGIFNPGSGGAIGGMDLSKSLLDTLHTATLYILGGKTDIAYTNGMDDFTRIDKVPVFLGNILNVGHGGTYWEPNGGKAAAAVIAWLDWRLRNDQNAAKTFVGEDCRLCKDAAWQVQKKRID